MNSPEKSDAGDTDVTVQRWFSADDMLLAIDAGEGDSEVSPMHDAVLLDTNAPLLTCIAMCNGADVDWLPTSRPEDSVLTHTLSLLERPEVSMGLAIPPDKALRFSQLPASVANLAVLSPIVHQVQLKLDHVVVSETESSDLQPGALLVLPASFGEYWRATLETAAGECRVFVQAQVGLVHFDSWDALPEPIDPQAACCDVYLQADIDLDLAEWKQAGYGDGTSVSTDGFLYGAVRVILTRPDAEPQSMMAQLVPIGDGYAVRIAAAQ